MRAAAYNNPNRPGTRVPPRMAPHHPSFLIDNPELETDLTCTKQTPDHISNRQYFAFLRLPDTLLPGSRRASLVSRKAVRATAKRRRAAALQKNGPTLTGRAWGTRKDKATRARSDSHSEKRIPTAVRKKRAADRGKSPHKTSIGHPENRKANAAGARVFGWGGGGLR